MVGKGLIGTAGIILILLSLFSLNCGKKEEESPFRTEGSVKPATPEELFEQAVKPMRDFLDLASVAVEGESGDDPAYVNMKKIQEMVLNEGTTYESIKEESPFGAIAMGEWDDVPPSKVHPLLAEVLEDVEPGGASEILKIEGQGYGMVIVKSAGAKEGTVNIGVVVLPSAAAPTTEISEEGGTMETVGGEAPAVTPAPG